MELRLRRRDPRKAYAKPDSLRSDDDDSEWPGRCRTPLNDQTDEPRSQTAVVGRSMTRLAFADTFPRKRGIARVPRNPLLKEGAAEPLPLVRGSHVRRP